MTLYCVDTSAWHRSNHPNVALRWSHLLTRDEIGLCDQVRLEILYSAQSFSDCEKLAEELSGLHDIPSPASVFVRALETQRKLAHIGGLHHRSVKIADLLVAAAAETAGAVVLHYDADYDRIASITKQPVEWIAQKGSL